MTIPIFSGMVRAAFAPSSFADETAATANGYAPAVVLGAVWSAFCGLLALRGHAPSFVLLPIAREHYYLVQAIFVLPVMLASVWLMAAVAFRTGGARDEQRPLVRAVVGHGYAAPMLFAFISVDIVIYAVSGFEGMTRAIRYYALVAPVWSAVVTTIMLRRILACSRLRAFATAAAALFAQALLAGTLLR